MDRSLGIVLKELRKKKKFTAKETADRLSSLGYEISEKTISGYETGIRMPNADIFMALCTIYDCKNILEMFSFIKADYSIPTDSEWKMIEKYRFISAHSPDGASVVDTVLNREYAIAKQLTEKNGRIKELEKELIPKRIFAYYGKIAAAGTSVEFSGMTAGLKSYPENDINANADYVIGVSGASMEPEYYDGDIVYVQKTEHLNVGNIGIFQKNNNIYIKKVGENGLISLNPKYPSLTADDDIITVLGRVLGKAED